MGILIKGGHLVDPMAGIDENLDLWIEEGIVKEVGYDLSGRYQGETVDARGLTVMPGLVDMHVHLRDPGQTQKEDFGTGTLAALAGGVTSLVAMPNTTPVVDRPERLALAQERIECLAKVHVYQTGAMTEDEAGKKLSDIEGMARQGVIALSEDGKSVMDVGLCREAFREAKRNNLMILDHCEDMVLRGKGCMHEDENAKRLGLPGIPSSTEDVISARDMFLAGEVGARLHFCHMSTRGAVECLRAGKRLGFEVTGEACPHHFILSSDDIPSDDPNYKMNPPLRSRQDVEAILEGLMDGTIPVISTDHAPHTREDKAGSMRTAAFGIVGLETSFALSYTHLVRTGRMTLSVLLEKMSANPARILGLSCGTLQAGHPADLFLADLGEEWTIDPEKFYSKGKNTPFAGHRVYGRVKLTMVDGKVAYRLGER